MCVTLTTNVTIGQIHKGSISHNELHMVYNVCANFHAFVRKCTIQSFSMNMLRTLLNNSIEMGSMFEWSTNIHWMSLCIFFFCSLQITILLLSSPREKMSLMKALKCLIQISLLSLWLDWSLYSIKVDARNFEKFD